MRFLFQILLSFVGSFIAILLTHALNIFDYIVLVPTDKKFDVCLMVYFSVIESLIVIGCEKYTEWMKQRKTSVEAYFYLPNEVKNKDAKPIVRFNEYDIAEVRLGLKITGKSCHVCDNGLMIFIPKQVDAQFSSRGMGTKQDNQGDLKVYFADVCKNVDRLFYEEEYKISLQRRDFDNRTSITIVPNLVSKDKNIIFARNEACLFFEERA